MHGWSPPSFFCGITLVCHRPSRKCLGHEATARGGPPIWGEEMTKNDSLSRWNNPIWKSISDVWWEMRPSPMGWSLMAVTLSGGVHGMVGRWSSCLSSSQPHWLLRLQSIQSINAVTEKWELAWSRKAGRETLDNVLIVSTCDVDGFSGHRITLWPGFPQ